MPGTPPWRGLTVPASRPPGEVLRPGLAFPVRSRGQGYDAAANHVGAGRVPVSGTQPAPGDPILDLLPLIRRVVGARVRDPHTVEDLVQETLARVMAARTGSRGTRSPRTPWSPRGT